MSAEPMTTRSFVISDFHRWMLNESGWARRNQKASPTALTIADTTTSGTKASRFLKRRRYQPPATITVAIPRGTLSSVAPSFEKLSSRAAHQAGQHPSAENSTAPTMNVVTIAILRLLWPSVRSFGPDGWEHISPCSLAGQGRQCTQAAKR